MAIWGLRDQQLQVLVDPEQLQAKGVTLDDVITDDGQRGVGVAVELP